MINTKSLKYCLWFIIVSQDKLSATLVADAFFCSRSIYDMISSTTINTSSSSRHTVYNILIWNFNIDRIINLLSHLSKCTIKCLCLWNCTRESIKYISILTIFLVYSVYNEINNQFIRNHRV